MLWVQAFWCWLHRWSGSRLLLDEANFNRNGCANLQPLSMDAAQRSIVHIRTSKATKCISECIQEGASIGNLSIDQYVAPNSWRRRRDSNPRDGFPPTPLAGERLRPLGHVSTDAYSQANIGITRRFCPSAKKPYHTRKPAQVAPRGTERLRVWARSGQFPLQRKRPRTGQAVCVFSLMWKPAAATEFHGVVCDFVTQFLDALPRAAPRLAKTGP